MKAKRKTKVFLAVIMSLVMLLGTASSAFAATTNFTTPETGDGAGVRGIYGNSTDPAQISLSKTFKIMDGTTLPDSGITFTFTATANDRGAGLTSSDDPTVAIDSVTFKSTDMGTASGGVKSSTKTANVTITPNKTGYYKFAITEATSYTNKTTKTDDDPYTDKVNTENTTYALRVWIGADSTGTLYVKTITLTGSDGNTKLDSLAFTNNSYNRYLNPDPTNPDPTNPDEYHAALTVKRVIDDDTYVGKESTAYIKFYAPSIGGAESSYTGKMYKADGTYKKDVSVTVNAAGSSTGTETTVSNFANGDYILFDTLPVGLTYDIKEDGITDGYKPTITVTPSSGAGTITNGTTDGAGATALGNTIKESATGNVALISGEKDSNDGAITGLVIDNLPFIIMGAVVLAGLGVVIASRRRYTARG